jgi:hypothetical protein
MISSPSVPWPATLLLQFACGHAGFVERCAAEHDFGAERARVDDLGQRGVLRHDDRRDDAVGARGKGDALGVVAG